MHRLARLGILIGVFVLFCGIISLIFLLIISGGSPLTYLRATYMRLTLSTREADLNQPAGSDNAERMFTIETGDTPISIGQHLYTQGLIRDPELFVTYMIVQGMDTQVQQGTFFLRQTMSIPQIAAQITDRQNAGIVFTILPGTRLEEIGLSIDAAPRMPFTGADFLAVTMTGVQIDPQLASDLAIPAGGTLEGYMYPDTYLLSLNSTATTFRDMVLARFREQIALPFMTAAQEQGYTIREIVILASIIEREAVWDDEMPLISSVYRNRLSISMKLDADPTVQYGMANSSAWWPRITQADYQFQSPYNTYVNYGLPPAPIANPGLAAIRAALYPTASAYLYFRARCDGSNYHVFATTYEEHLNNGC